MTRAAAVAAALAALAACDHGSGAAHRKGAPPTTPSVHVEGCGYASDPAGHAVIGGDFGEVTHCFLIGAGAIELDVLATPGARLTIGELPATTVPGDGHARVAVPLDPALLAAPARELVAGKARLSPLRLAVRLEPVHGDPVTGTIVVDPTPAGEPRARELLEAVGRGTPLPRPAATPSASTPAASPVVAGSLVYLPASRYAHGVPLGRDAALAAVDLVAVTRDVARHDGAACGPYQGAPGGVTMAPRVDVDVEVTIVDATTGAAVDRRTFRDGFDDCPMFATFRGDRYELVEARPAVATLEPWLVEVASRRVPSP